MSVIFKTVKYIPQNFLKLGVRTVEPGYGNSLPSRVLHSEAFFNVLCLNNPALAKDADFHILCGLPAVSDALTGGTALCGSRLSPPLKSDCIFADIPSSVNA